MKQSILNTLGILFIVYPVYAFYLVSRFLVLDVSGYGVMSAIFLLSLVFFVAAGVGLLLKKDFSIISYWAALIFFYILVLVYGGTIPLINEHVFLVLNTIVAMFLSRLWGKLAE